MAVLNVDFSTITPLGVVGLLILCVFFLVPMSEVMMLMLKCKDNKVDIVKESVILVFVEEDVDVKQELYKTIDKTVLPHFHLTFLSY